MKLTPLEGSSNVKAVGYDPATREMQVQFKGGAIYTHANVPAEKHTAFMRAQSYGTHYHDNFRGKPGVKRLDAL